MNARDQARLDTARTQLASLKVLGEGPMGPRPQCVPAHPIDWMGIFEAVEDTPEAMAAYEARCQRAAEKEAQRKR